MRTLLAFVLFTVFAVDCNPSSPVPVPTPAPSATSAPSASPLGFIPTKVYPASPVTYPVDLPAYHDPKKLMASFAAPPPVFQTSWTQATWCIDPQNASTCASDTNATCGSCSCTSGDGPCSTWAQVAARWGTYSPRLRQDTTITFDSAQTAATDPIIWTPYEENGSHLTVQGVLGTAQQVATGTLSSVTAKNRNTPQLLQAAFGSTLTAGTLIVNSTHPSRAFLRTNVSGTTWTITQPLVAIAMPTSPSGTEVDTWANGDAWTAYTPVAVNIETVVPTYEAFNATTFDNLTSLYQISNYVAAVPYATMTLGSNVQIVESVINGYELSFNSSAGYFTNAFVNNYITSIVLSQSNPIPYFGLGSLVYGGFTSTWLASGSFFNYDVILTAVSGSGTFAKVYLANSAAMVVSGGSSINSGGIVWGPGNINVTGNTRLVYTPTQATAAFLTTIDLDGTATGCSHTGASPDVVSCGISLTGAHLDAAQGVAGFGGLAYTPGGASIFAGGY
jgi:hypothetical protein